MSDYQIIDVDRSALPTALLPIAKVHMRVEFSRDDEYIRLCLVRAIDLFERVSGWMVFAAHIAWQAPVGTGADRYQTPVQPVSQAVVMSAGNDVSSEYEIRYTTADAPYWLVHKDGTAFPADAAITLTAGYATADDMNPAALDIVLRIANTLYEQRESVTTPIQQMPMWLNDLLVGTWIPRA